MSYNIVKSDGSTLVVVPQESQDTTSTSLTLFGKLKTNYGGALNENFVHILENFSNAVAPTTSIEGQLWWDKANKILKIYSSGAYVGIKATSLNGKSDNDFLLKSDNLSTLPDFANARNNLDVYSKSEMDIRYVNTSGDTMTGSLILNADPTSDLHAATKQYVDKGHWYMIPEISTPPHYYTDGLTGFDAYDSPDMPTLHQSGWTMMTGNGTRGAQMSIGWDNGSVKINVRTKDVNFQNWSPWQEIAFDADKLSLSGGVLTGPLLLNTDPSTSMQAATKQYVDKFLPLTGGNITGNISITGNITVSTIPTDNMSVVPKVYVDGNFLSLSGGTMTGNLILNTSPTSSMQAATKQYVDNALSVTNSYVVKTGDVMTGELLLSGVPVSNMGAVPKDYVDTRVFRSGDTLTGFLTLHAPPTGDMHATNKQYVDELLEDYLLLDGGTMTGSLILVADPVDDLEAATKQYVDVSIANLVDSAPDTLNTLNELSNALGDDPNFATTVATNIGSKVSKAGDTMTGMLTLSGAPSNNLHAATKLYVDTSITTSANTKVSKAGDTMTGFLTLSADPTSSLHASTKQYVDNVINNIAKTNTVNIYTAAQIGSICDIGTNIFLQSNAFTDGAWTKHGVTITPSSTNTYEMVETVDNTPHRLYPTTAINFVSGTTYTMSFFVKYRDAKYVQLRFNQGPFPMETWCIFDLISNTMIQNTTNIIAYGIEPAKNGFVRIWMSATATATGQINAALLILSPDSTSSIYIGQNRGVYIYGAQLEVGQIPTTYVQTTTPPIKTLDLSTSNNFTLTLNSSITLANPTNIVPGQSGVITIRENSTGGYGITSYGTYWVFPNKTAPTLTTTAGAVNVLAYYVISPTEIVVTAYNDVGR